MITPTLNINGSSMADLVEPRLAAYNAIQAAIKALQQVTPNGRDYPGDNDKCLEDRGSHYARLRTLNACAMAIMEEVAVIQNQKREYMMTAEDRLLSDLREVSRDLQEWAQDRIDDGYKAAGIIQMLREAARIAGRD
jgi:hypothetical protein